MLSKRPPLNREMRWIWIIAALKCKGTSLADVSRELRLPRRDVSYVKTRKRPVIEKAIADKLGLPPSDIWPERYADVADNSQSRRSAQ